MLTDDDAGLLQIKLLGWINDQKSRYDFMREQAKMIRPDVLGKTDDEIEIILNKWIIDNNVSKVNAVLPAIYQKVKKMLMQNNKSDSDANVNKILRDLFYSMYILPEKPPTTTKIRQLVTSQIPSIRGRTDAVRQTTSQKVQGEYESAQRQESQEKLDNRIKEIEKQKALKGRDRSRDKYDDTYNPYASRTLATAFAREAPIAFATEAPPTSAVSIVAASDPYPQYYHHSDLDTNTSVGSHPLEHDPDFDVNDDDIDDFFNEKPSGGKIKLSRSNGKRGNKKKSIKRRGHRTKKGIIRKNSKKNKRIRKSIKH